MTTPAHQARLPRDGSIWIREFEDDDWEIGILEHAPYGLVMHVDTGFCYFFGLNLRQWQKVGDL